MKIVIFGLSISSSWGNGHATLWRGLCRALDELGHDLVFFERDVPYYAAHRDLSMMSGGRLVLYPSFEDALSRVRAELADADAAILTSYCPDAEPANREMHDSRALRIFYDLDTPVTLERLAAGEAVAYIGPQGLSEFDLVLSYTGGRALTELQSRLGARRVAPLYGSVDPQVHEPAAPIPEFRADLSYLGTFARDRQAALEELFIEPARQRSGLRFIIGGAQYPKEFPWAANISFVQHLPPAQHADFYSSSRWTLNVTRSAMAAMGFCPSGRLFEAAACGAPMLSDQWEGIEQFFTPGREIVLVDSRAEVLEALHMPEDARRRIAHAARERVLAEHTAMHRALELVGLIGQARAAVANPLMEV